MFKLTTLFVLTILSLNYRPSESIICYSCTGWNAACNDPIDTTKLQWNTVQCSGSCYVYNNPYDGNMIYRGCTTGSTIDSFGGKSGAMTSSAGITYNLCTTDNCNTYGTTSASTTTASVLTSTAATAVTTIATVASTTTTSSTLYCYECNSNWAACADPPNLGAIAGNRIACSGSCYVSYQYGILYRGCSTNYGKMTGTVTDNNGIVYNLCSTSDCNVYGATTAAVTTSTSTTAPVTTTTTIIVPITTTTTVAPVTTTVVPVTTTVAPVTTTTTLTTTTLAGSYCYQCDSFQTSACADPINVSLLGSYLVQCTNSCFTTMNAKGIISRGCSTEFGTGYGALAIRGSNGQIYHICDVSLCNTYSYITGV
jgi:hypothetical protein